MNWQLMDEITEDFKAYLVSHNFLVKHTSSGLYFTNSKNAYVLKLAFDCDGFPFIMAPYKNVINHYNGCAVFRDCDIFKISRHMLSKYFYESPKWYYKNGFTNRLTLAEIN